MTFNTALNNLLWKVFGTGVAPMILALLLKSNSYVKYIDTFRIRNIVQETSSTQVWRDH